MAADFSIISQNATIRGLVQQNMLQRALHDALYPKMLFRMGVIPQVWAANAGDSQLFSAPGLMTPNQKPTVPGIDPLPRVYTAEQWQAQAQQYSDTIDTNMPDSIVAIADLFLRNAQQLGLLAAQTMNRIVRNRRYNAAMSGWTVTDGAQVAVTTLAVKRLNGFTTARNPTTAGASQVSFSPVSSVNPLAISIFDTTLAYVSRNVIGFTPTNVGDTSGPGTLTLSAAVTVDDRKPVYSVDRTAIVRVSGGDSVESITPASLPKLASIRSALAIMRTNSVPEQADGSFHSHMDPVSEALIFADPEFQRLHTALPSEFTYQEFSISRILGSVFFRNNECPVASTVNGGDTASYSDTDPFGGELFSNGLITGTPVHRILFSGAGSVTEYYNDLGNLMTEAGIPGRVGEPTITNNGILVMSDRIQLLIRQPLNRLMDLVSTSWKFIGDWPVRTDAATGSRSRYKREMCIEHGEPT